MIKTILITLSAIDDHVGRVDIESLSDETMLELMVQDLPPESKAVFIPEEASEEVFLTRSRPAEFDDKGHIVRIYPLSLPNEDPMYLEGTMHFEYMPRHVQSFNLYKVHDMKGTVETSGLPESLCIFVVSANKFSGSFNFEVLPKELRLLNLSYNAFSGSCVFTSLPVHLKEIFLQRNGFRGCIALHSLPRTLKKLNISENALSGSLILENLPDGLRSLLCQQNQFSGKFILRDKPQSLQWLYAGNNLFTGTATLHDAFSFRTTLPRCPIEAIRDQNGRITPYKAQRAPTP